MWWWVLIWALLLLCAAVYLGMRLWGLWGQTKELGQELALAQRRLDAVQGQLEHLGEATASPELAVFVDPAQARRQREQARAELRHARQVRRARNRPAWARHVD